MTGVRICVGGVFPLEEIGGWQSSIDAKKIRKGMFRNLIKYSLGSGVTTAYVVRAKQVNKKKRPYHHVNAQDALINAQ